MFVPLSLSSEFQNISGNLILLLLLLVTGLGTLFSGNLKHAIYVYPIFGTKQMSNWSMMKNVFVENEANSVT